jgi:hypothetical protein
MKDLYKNRLSCFEKMLNQQGLIQILSVNRVGGKPWSIIARPNAIRDRLISIRDRLDLDVLLKIGAASAYRS